MNRKEYEEIRNKASDLLDMLIRKGYPKNEIAYAQSLYAKIYDLQFLSEEERDQEFNNILSKLNKDNELAAGIALVLFL